MSSGFAGRGLRQGYNALALLHSNAVCFLLRARERGGGRRSRFSALSRAKLWPHAGQVVGGRRSDAGALAWNVGSRHVRERVASNNELTASGEGQAGSAAGGSAARGRASISPVGYGAGTSVGCFGRRQKCCGGAFGSQRLPEKPRRVECAGAPLGDP